MSSALALTLGMATGAGPGDPNAAPDLPLGVPLYGWTIDGVRWHIARLLQPQPMVMEEPWPNEARGALERALDRGELPFGLFKDGELRELMVLDIGASEWESAPFVDSVAYPGASPGSTGHWSSGPYWRAFFIDMLLPNRQSDWLAAAAVTPSAYREYELPLELSEGTFAPLSPETTQGAALVRQSHAFRDKKQDIDRQEAYKSLARTTHGLMRPWLKKPVQAPLFYRNSPGIRYVSMILEIQGASLDLSLSMDSRWDISLLSIEPYLSQDDDDSRGWIITDEDDVVIGAGDSAWEALRSIPWLLFPEDVVPGHADDWYDKNTIFGDALVEVSVYAAVGEKSPLLWSFDDFVEWATDVALIP